MENDHGGARASGSGAFALADSVPGCGHTPRGASSGRPRCENRYSGRRDDPDHRHHHGHLGVSLPAGPGNRRPTGPSPATPGVAPAVPDVGRPRDPAPLVGTPARADAGPEGLLAAVRGRLAQLLPRRGARSGARQAAEFDVAARNAYESALKLEAGAPLSPEPPAAGSSGASTTEPPTVAAPGPTTPDAAEPTAAAEPRPPAEPPEEPLAPARRRQPGEAALDFLLRTPTNVAPVADDFFDGLVRRVEGDR